ncbi:acyltransferase [bacterium]|nr:acyltransferase [bacterium]
MTETKPVSRLAYVDGLRALSALWVILYDVWRFNREPDLGLLTPVCASGHLGVEIFMVLSGFCLFYPMAHLWRLPVGHWRTFFVRRAKRILPPYYAALLYAIVLPHALAPLFAATGLRFTPEALPSAWSLFVHVTMLQNLVDLPGLINPSFWSLSLEAQYYLVFPLLALAILRWRWKGVLAILAVCGLYRLGFLAILGANLSRQEFLLFNSIVGRLAIFTAGMVVALVIRETGGKRPEGLLDTLWGLSTVPLVMLGFYWYFHPVGAWPLSDVCLGVAAGGILLRYADGARGLGRALAWPALVSLGEMSYSFYLINRPTCYYVNHAVSQLVPGSQALQMGVTLAVGVPLSLAIAAGFYRWVERPFMVRRPRPELQAQPVTPVASS